VLVGGEDAFAVQVVGVLDHLEQRLVLRLSVDVPGGVEDLVAAVLGVGLREHHEFDVVGVASKGLETCFEVIDLVVGEGEAEGLVGGFEGGAAFGEHGNARHGAGRLVAEEGGAGVEVFKDDLGHAVVEFGGDGGELVGVERGLGGDGVGDDALDAFEVGQAADVGDVGGLGGPGGNGAGAGGDDQGLSVEVGGGAAGAVGEEFFEHVLLVGGEVGGEFGDVHKPGVDGADGQAGGGQVGEQFVEAKFGEGGGAAEDQHGQRRKRELRHGRPAFGDRENGRIFRRAGGRACRARETR